MKKRMLPRTELNCSSVCLGTARFGSDISEEQSFTMLDRFVEAGGNFLDSARVYADWLPNGASASERTIGNWMNARKNRDRIVLATKGGHPPLSDMTKSRLAREDVEQDVDQSLKCLATDHIDLYLLHRDDVSRDVVDIMETMNALVRSGKIRYFGCSNWREHRVAEALQYSATHGLASFVAIQNLWSLAFPDMKHIPDSTVIQMDPATIYLCKEAGLTIMPYTSQANGFFTKHAVSGRLNYDPSIKGPFESALNYARLRAVVRIAKQRSVSVTEVVLAYLTSQPTPTIPIIGPSHLDQLLDSLRNTDLHLDWDTLRELETGDLPARN